MKKAFTKVSTSILVILLTVMMLFNVATDAVGGGVQAAGYIKKLTSVDTNYKSFVNGDVAFELPSTVKDDDIISVIVMLNTPSLLETYNANGQLTFTQYVFSEEANQLRESVTADKNKISEKLNSLGIKHSTGAEYETVLTGYEVLIEARYFKNLCEVLGDTRQAVVGEVYKPAETQLVEMTPVFSTPPHSDTMARVSSLRCLTPVLTTPTMRSRQTSLQACSLALPSPR